MPLAKFLLVSLLVGFAGCASQMPLVKLRISGGERIMVEFPKGTVKGEENDDVMVDAAVFLVKPQFKKGNHCISVEFGKNATPQSVKVEDMTGDQAQLLIDDKNPKLTGRAWRCVCASLGPDDPSLQWLHDIDDSFCVYRITVVLTDGRQIVQHHAIVYPAYRKAQMRRDFGIDTP
jgi:hypothetical protein